MIFHRKAIFLNVLYFPFSTATPSVMWFDLSTKKPHIIVGFFYGVISYQWSKIIPNQCPESTWLMCRIFRHLPHLYKPYQ